jgi:hypothetical protein
MRVLLMMLTELLLLVLYSSQMVSHLITLVSASSPIPCTFIKAEVLPSGPATRAPQNDAAEIEQTQKVGTRIAIAVLSHAYQFNNAYYAVTHTMKYCYSLQKKNSSFLELCSTQLTRTTRTRSSLSMFWSQF